MVKRRHIIESLMRPRYGQRSQSSSGDADRPVGVISHGHGHRSRSLMGRGPGSTALVAACILRRKRGTGRWLRSFVTFPAEMGL